MRGGHEMLQRNDWSGKAGWGEEAGESVGVSGEETSKNGLDPVVERIRSRTFHLGA